MFTSGTTGRPKGAMLTHGQTLRVFDDWCDIVGMRVGDRYLIVNPFFHTFGYKAGIIGSLLRGATMYPLAVFDAAEVVRRVVADRITVLPGAPTLFQSILNLPDRADLDLSSLRLAITGAAVVPVEMIRADARRAGLQRGADRLRPHRDQRHGDDVPPRRHAGDRLACRAARRCPTPR